MGLQAGLSRWINKPRATYFEARLLAALRAPAFLGERFALVGRPGFLAACVLGERLADVFGADFLPLLLVAISLAPI